jgi:hypothetical protein
MRGGYVGLMNCVFAAQKAVRPFHLSSSVHVTSSGDYKNHILSPGTRQQS